MSKLALDTKLAALEALRTSDDHATIRDPLRKALNDRNNYVVSRAAAIVADMRCDELLPEVLAAFDRFFVDAVKSDPQCLAKNALARALRDLGHRGAQAFLRGIVHVQLEPTWGGRADSAGTLRGICALALADCPLDPLEILTYLADGLADPDKLVRINSAIAISQLGQPEGALLLRLRLLAGDAEPDVLGQCFTSFLSLAPTGSVSFVSRFLRSADEDVQLEAASALAQCRDPRAIRTLAEFWQEPLLSLELRRAIVISLGASPLPEAAEFLLTCISHERPDLAETAIASLATSRYRSELCPRVAAALETRADAHLKSIFDQTFGRATPT
jgi:HEAT repeat protein